MKKIVFLLFVIFSVCVIYFTTADKKIYYLSLDTNNSQIGNYDYSYYVSNYLNEKGILEDYVYKYSKNDKKIPDLINDVKNNLEIDGYTLKNSLIKADLVTIRIYDNKIMDMLRYETINFVYDYIDSLCDDLEKFIKLIRKYCKEDVLLLGHPVLSNFTTDQRDVIEYLNRKYKNICEDYGVVFVDLNNFDDKNISNKIIKYLGKKLKG